MFQNLGKVIIFPLNIKALVHLASRMKVTEYHALNQTNYQLKVNCWIKLCTLLQGSCRVSSKKADTVVQKSSLTNTAYTHHPTAILPEAVCQKKQLLHQYRGVHTWANTVISPLQCICCLLAMPAVTDRQTDMAASRQWQF